jgi:DNA-binding NarL/FixJ family response regulator
VRDGPIRVAVVDDHPVVRFGLVAMLDRLDDVDVVAEASTGAEALAVIDAVVPDVVLLDLNLPDTTGERVAASIARQHPEVAVIVLTMRDDEARVVASLRAGARGYLLKGAAPDELVRTIRAVAAGELVVGPGVADHLSAYLRSGATTAEAAFPQLTNREREVLSLLADSATNDMIARRLAIRPKTVRNLVSQVLVKINARDRSDAITRARAAGFGGE